MGPNLGWGDRFSDIVSLLHGDRDRRGPRLRASLRHAVRSPVGMRAARLVPDTLHRRLGRLWSARMFDWQQTRFFALPSDVGGLVRFNLRGREPEGTVPRGAEFDALCDELIDELYALEDVETGDPIIAAVDRTDDVVGLDAPFRDVLPDLTAHWAGRTLGQSIGVRSRRRGELVWQRGQKLTSGRSGNHRLRGWLLTAGTGIAPGTVPAASTLDLVPSIFHVLGAALPPDIAARPFEPLLGSQRESPGAQPGGQ
jgi:hypothetical protein